MKNKELLNICYKFFNRHIIADELIDKLSKMDKSNFSDKEEKEVIEMISEIKRLITENPNEIDDYVIEKKKAIKRMITKLEGLPHDDSNYNFFNSQVQNLKKDYDKEIDSYKRWFAVMDYIVNNEYFNKTFDSLSDYELLEFISQNIKAPCPPNLTQEEFDRLVKVGIDEDKREWLWRLAFNYEERNLNLEEIVDYFIEMKDGYYLAELISAVGEKLNIDDIVDKVNDKKLIEDLKDRKGVISAFVSDEQFNRLMDKIS